MEKKPPLKPILLIVLLLATVIGGGMALIALFVPVDRIVALALPRAEKTLGRKVVIEKARLTFFPRLGISLSGVKVDNTGRAGFTPGPFLSVDKFTAAVSIGSLLRGSPEVTTITLRNPVILIETDSTGSFNFADLGLQPPRDSSDPPAAQNRLPLLPLPMTLKKLRVTGGTLVWIDRKAGSRTIGKIDQTARFSIDRSLRDITSSGTLTMSDLSLQSKLLLGTLSGLSLTVSHSLHADLQAGVVQLDSARLSLGPFSLLAFGSVTRVLSANPQADLTVTSNFHSAKRIGLASLAPKLSAAGGFDLDSRIQGALARPLVTGTLKVRDFSLQHAGLPGSINGCTGDLSFTDKSLKTESFGFRIGSSPVAITGVVNDFDKPLVDATVKADLNLDEMKDVIALPAGVALGGKGNVDIRIDGLADRADPGKLFFTGTIGLGHASVQWPPLAVPAVLDGRISFEKEAATAAIAAKLGGSSLSLTAAATHYLWLAVPPEKRVRERPDINFSVNAGSLDFDTVMSLFPGTGTGPQKPAPAPLPTIPPLPMVDMHGVLTARRIAYQGVAFTDVTVKTASVRNVADVGCTAGFAGGTIDNTLHADLGRGGSVVFADKLAVRSIELHDLMARFGRCLEPVTPLNRQLVQIDKCLYGRVSASGSMQGSGGSPEQIMRSLAGTVTLNMKNGRIVNSPIQKAVALAMGSFLKTDKLGSINPITFSALDAKAHVGSSRAVIDELKIVSDLGDWDARGAIGFDAVMDLSVSTKLNRELSRQVLALENTAKSAAKGALKGTGFESVATGLLDNLSLIPHDNQGRIPLRFALAGRVDAPKVTSVAFGGNVQGSSSRSPAPGGGRLQQSIGKAIERAAEPEGQRELQKAGERLKQRFRGLFK